MTLTEQLLSDPRIVTALGLVLLGAVIALRNVGPRRALLFEPIRTVAFRLLNPIATKRGRPLIREKTEDQAEFIATVDASELELAKLLWDGGYRWNPISTKKFRVVESRQWSILSVAYRDSVADEDQHHVYIFRRGDGLLDVYGHREASITDPDAHDGGDDLVPGDPDNRVATILQQAGADFKR